MDDLDWLSDSDDGANCTVNVCIHSARDLPGANASKADIYLKVLCDDQVRWFAQKKGSLNPEWNEWKKMSFSEQPLQLTVQCWNYEAALESSEETVGEITLELSKYWDTKHPTAWHKLGGSAGDVCLELSCEAAEISSPKTQADGLVETSVDKNAEIEESLSKVRAEARPVAKVPAILSFVGPNNFKEEDTEDIGVVFGHDLSQRLGSSNWKVCLCVLCVTFMHVLIFLCAGQTKGVC